MGQAFLPYVIPIVGTSISIILIIRKNEHTNESVAIAIAPAILSIIVGGWLFVYGGF